MRDEKLLASLMSTMLVAQSSQDLDTILSENDHVAVVTYDSSVINENQR